MKLIENKPYLTMQECVECGMDEGYLRKAKSVGTRCWDFIDDPADRRRVLVGFEGMKDVYREKVMKRYGNLYEHLARTPILNMVASVANFKEHDFFMKYRHCNTTGSITGPSREGKALPIDTVNRYTRADKWLQMLKRVREHKRMVKKELGLTFADFYTQVGQLISLEKERGKIANYKGLDVLPGDFPGTYQRLITKLDRYITNGPQEIIDERFGNKNAAKLGKVNGDNGSIAEWLNGSMKKVGNVDNAVNVKHEEHAGNAGFNTERYNEQMAVIRTIAAMHNNFDAAQVAKLANMIFAANGWETVSRGTVYNIISENKHMLTAGRRGKRTYMSEVAMQVKRKAPQHPMQYWTLDGWTVELMYQTPAPKGVQYKRLVMVIVLDACGKYPVGYAIGERENSELIREANRNALKHVCELLGAHYKPWQLQSDNYQIKNLTPFYQAMSHLHSPAAVGNAKSKIIEPYFMYLNKTYCQLLPNWSGFNVNSKKENQVNAEYLDKIKHTFPDRAGVVRQIERMIAQEREKKINNYMAQWLNSPMDKKPEVMSDMDYLIVMGVPLGTRTNRIAGQGIVKKINNAEYTYDSFDPAFRANSHVDWQLYGDEYDLDKVLAVSPDGTLKFVLEQKHALPMDARSMTADDRKHLGLTKKFNDERIEEITKLYASDREVTREIIAHTPLAIDNADELALKMMFTYGGQQKEYLQDAKSGSIAQLQNSSMKKEKKRIAKEVAAEGNEWEAMQQLYLESKTDLSIYSD